MIRHIFGRIFWKKTQQSDEKIRKALPSNGPQPDSRVAGMRINTCRGTLAKGWHTKPQRRATAAQTLLKTGRV